MVSMLKSLAILCVLFLMYLVILPSMSGICKADDWTPPPPSGDDGFDWIELKSGEWLKGSIKSMQQEKLEFDSEELDVRVWNWEDIRTVRSPRLLSIRFSDNQIVVGSLLVNMNEVQVVNQSGTHTFPRADLLGFTPMTGQARASWSFDFSFGIISREGNTREVSNNVHAILIRQSPQTRQKLEYLSNYGELDGNKSKDDQRWLVNSDFFLSRAFFIRAPDLEYLHDSQQNLAYRITLGSSVGYDLINNSRTEWQLTAGPAFQYNKYNATGTDTANTKHSGTLVLGFLFDIKLTKRIDFTIDYRGQFTRRETGSNMHHTMSTLEFEIHKLLILDLSFIWDRIAKPEPDENGVTPKPDDFQFITSLGIHF